MTDLRKADFWQQVAPGHLVVVSDAQALLEAVRQDLDAEGGLNYEVKRVLRLKELSALAEWVLVRLEGADEIWLMAKIVGDAVDLRLYFEVPEFPPGNRADMLDQDMYWLFEDPGPDWQDCYEVLQFAQAITVDQEPGEAGTPTSTCYRQKPWGTLYGQCRETPASPLGEPYAAAIIEYQTEDPSDNPELLILELGGEQETKGGYITMMLGCPAEPSELRVFQP